MEQILCPHCGKKVELSQALFHEVEQKISEQLKLQQRSELEKLKQQTLQETKRKLQEELDFKLKNSENESKELKDRNKELQEQLLELNKKIRELLEQNEKSKLESERKLTDQIVKFQSEFEQKAKMEKLELEKKLLDTQKALEDAQRKTKQGSQQLQGEVLELDLETQIKTSFPDDLVSPVAKGVKGADLIQSVRNKAGRQAGTILWEAKRARWNQGWITKLKEDLRTAAASEAVLVVEELPEKVKNSGLVQGIWVTSYKDVLTVASTLRLLLMKVASARLAAENKDERLEELYQYITSDAFRHRIESQIESFIQMKTDLDTEKRSMERIWSKREVQISRLEKNTTNIFGELQGIAGEGLPTIKSLDSPDSELKLIEES